ncbi:tRNA splicing endonuclease [Thermoplasmatales archaeon SCGC AB-539-C06]|nr:tRNA splicing endonuclease [Thermoplasmatales archaeon SCGC AB-539-C06]
MLISAHIQKKPDEIHAEYLIHAVDKKFKRTWAEISRAVRLAHSVNKEIMFARVEENNIDYIRFGSCAHNLFIIITRYSCGFERR